MGSYMVYASWSIVRIRVCECRCSVVFSANGIFAKTGAVSRNVLVIVSGVKIHIGSVPCQRVWGCYTGFCVDGDDMGVDDESGFYQ